MCLVEAKLVSINVNNNNKKNRFSIMLGRYKQKYKQTYWNRREHDEQTCCFPSPTLSCPGEMARGGQTLLDTLACFMVTYFKACMCFGDCRTWSTSCEMSENMGVRRPPSASPGFLPPGQHMFAETESRVEKKRAKDRWAEEWKNEKRRLIYGTIDSFSLFCRRRFTQVAPSTSLSYCFYA